ncbi:MULTISPECIES: 3-hydroxybenzoate 6-monooxygenase [unclassified Streptomyces]|uniref:3-hydroxybenzoate 6-monooxygenase n=1 Tax=unclassified Streptomyces TaxID=2593676 RepID=UPI0016619A14|nr:MULTISPECIES: 3-hydroxybenzoate 6-monooxygenase [unclassified Streptomyces]MBD0844203.1 3-hydroxybenzoate 6-monooxygenase [Streptomyces sp. TRM68416]
MAELLVAGGGIGGLAVALAAAGRGHRVTVLERRDEFTELGAGIQLAPNAFHALDRLGVGEDVRGRAVFIDALRLMDGTTDAEINAMPLGASYRERFGNPYAVVHRTDLYGPLLEACRGTPRIELCTGVAVAGYEQDDERVAAVLVGGERVGGDALIGADGIRSRVRAQMIGDGEPLVSGHTIYRSVVPMDRVPEELRSNSVTLWAGPGWHFVHYPISGGREFNLAVTRDDGACEAVAGRPTPSSHVLSQFSGMGSLPARLLSLGEQWKCWVLCDRDPVYGWTDGRVVLAGDAAHPMLQYAAQGACMALEDAVHLGSVLDCGTRELPQRFLEYNCARAARTARTQQVARAMGREVYHPEGVAAKERNEEIGALSETELFEKVAWLHDAVT